MMASRAALDFQAMDVALSPINLRETCALLMRSAPELAKQLQREIKDQRKSQGPIAEDYLGLHLNIETIGMIIVELTHLGQAALKNPHQNPLNRSVLKELIECWLQLAEWMLTDLEITDTLLH